ncbi:hypothetical protein C477_00715 [Haloterrigena salina JCM 13891]|uniref:Uncharacterized protein n=1 Tax=Haloterrigena salina JCM 13891 TaxID=1227488 RepID=M0CP70_9EURY|nr:hypothetical protein [Haloterrigena salina]ELZ24438.1 hypothetical protein C477_00715 [Haloterrigena salina JCM 13891]
MSTAVDVSKQCTFASAIDVTTILERLEIQFLDVDDHRAIVIFAGAILNLECRTGTLTNLTSAEITVYDLPVDSHRNSDGDDDTARKLLEDFLEQLADAGHPP